MLRPALDAEADHCDEAMMGSHHVNQKTSQLYYFLFIYIFSMRCTAK